ncbi:carbonic anhydrase [Catenuloplanes indicus]|uniref:carbonic anhydrase n=1 Tax=Catenuloplanes indicus TaxID=137267 RepID=A0AAE3VW59_9ACTN|nr:carbonic anhydrase [Catenuloplanes indicus]MDQ0364707.1 carbonic anhydrase [Catenuloplanes indicus]
MSHTTLRRRALLTAGGVAAGALALPAAASAAPATPPAEPAPTTPAAAVRRLLAGNRRFTSGRARHPHQSLDRLHEVAAGQHPFAVLLGCADSRVSPELLFDEGIGDLFDDRVAGNIVDDLLLGSMEYAVEEFAPPLIVVLGHERCGAISATINAINTGASAPGHIASIVAALRPIVAPYASAPDGVERAVQANIRAQAAAILSRSDIIRERVESGETAVVGARYDLDTGVVTLVR